MAKFQGLIGYIQTEETSPGVYTDVVTERPYKGDLLRNSQRWEASDERLNDDININNRFSIVADVYAYENMEYIRYIQWNGVKWRIKKFDVQRPRLILHVGGVYNA